MSKSSHSNLLFLFISLLLILSPINICQAQTQTQVQPQTEPQPQNPNLDQLINLAIDSNTEVAIARQQSKIEETSKFDAKTNFLPNVNARYNDGTRRRKISDDSSSKLSEDSKSITLEQPIFNGFSSVAKFKQANYGYNAALHRVNHIKNQIAFRVAEQYLNVFYLNQIVALETRNVDIMLQALNLANQSLWLQDIDYTKFTEISLKKNQVDLKRSTDILNHQESKVALAMLVGQDFNSSSLIEPDLEILQPLKELEQTIKTNNPALKEKELNVKAKSSGVKVKYGDFSPKASIYLEYEDQESSQYFGGQSTTNKIVYLNFTIPIFQKGTEYASLSRAKKEKSLAQLERRLTLEEAQRDLTMSYSRYSSLTQNLISLKETLSLSKKSFLLIKDRLEKRDVSKLDVLLQESELISMEVQALNLQMERAKSYFKIKEVINDIL